MCTTATLLLQHFSPSLASEVDLHWYQLRQNNLFQVAYCPGTQLTGPDPDWDGYACIFVPCRLQHGICTWSRLRLFIFVDVKQVVLKQVTSFHLALSQWFVAEVLDMVYWIVGNLWCTTAECQCPRLQCSQKLTLTTIPSSNNEWPLHMAAVQYFFVGIGGQCGRHFLFLLSYPMQSWAQTLPSRRGKGVWLQYDVPPDPRGV